MKQGQMVSQTTTLPMTNVGNGTWSTNFGYDQDLDWGTRSISFLVDGVNTYSSSATVFVYNVGYNKVPCTQVVSNYTQVNSGAGFGKYTKMLYNGNFTLIGDSFDRSFIGWAIYPWVQVWGYLFYFLIAFSIVSTLYLKSGNVIQPIASGIFILLVFAPSMWIDPAYRQWIIFALGLGMTGIYYKIFVRD